MKIKEIISEIERIAPLQFQESYDNAGLLVGDSQNSIKAALISLDVTEQVVDEAINKNAGLIITHHPVIFKGLKKLTGQNYNERVVIKAIKNDIAIYASHTNLDSVFGGVNSKICEKLQLKNCKMLQTKADALRKLVVFVPNQQADKVRAAMFEAGAGHIGEYDCCSYNIEGKGSFRASENANPFVGKTGEIHFESEIRVETIYPAHKERKIIRAMIDAHPYEEVAYDIYPLKNTFDNAGMGMLGELEKPAGEEQFLKQLKEIFGTPCIKHTKLLSRDIKKVAVCGGSGSFLIGDAKKAKADIFITADVKFHQFFDADDQLLIADIGHYESEQFTKDVFYDILTKKIPNFAFYLSETNTNPVFYF